MILVVFAILFVRYYGRGPSRHYSDFRVYHTAAVRFLNGEDIYRELEGITPFKYSPVFAVLISPLGLLPIHAASLVFFTVNFWLLIFLAVYCRKMISDGREGRWGGALLLAIPSLFVLRFALLVLDSGQVNLLMISLALAGVYLTERKKELAGGMLLGLSVMVKYVTFIFVPYWILKRKWKAALSAIFSIVIYCYLPALFCGFERAHRYLLEWIPFITKTSLDRGSWTDYKNQSVYSWVIRLLMKDSPYKDNAVSFSIVPFQSALLAGVAIAVLLYVLAIFLGSMRRGSVIGTYAALFTGIALFNPNCWPFNYVALFFPVMVVTAEIWKSGWKDHWSIFFLAAAFLAMNIGGQLFSNEKIQFFSEVMSFMTIGGLLVYAACIRLNFLKGKDFFEI